MLAGRRRQQTPCGLASKRTCGAGHRSCCCSVSPLPVMPCPPCPSAPRSDTSGRKGVPGFFMVVSGMVRVERTRGDTCDVLYMVGGGRPLGGCCCWGGMLCCAWQAVGEVLHVVPPHP